MRTLRLEFLRLNDLATGIWRQGDPYLVAAGSDEPVRQFTSPLDHEAFLDLVRALRYQEDAQARQSALREIGDIAAGLLGIDRLQAVSTGTFPLQLDLVVNPAEVAALPFEAAVDGEGRPLFARTDRAVVLTRRVRHGFTDGGVRWPVAPRVLYAWAAPPGAGDVPAEEHERALRRALEPWRVEADAAVPDDDVLTVIAETRLAALAGTCRDAAARQRPFTHVHLLAHGVPVALAHRQQFGVALHADDGELHAVAPEEVVAALSPLAGHAVVVTMATCDSANLTNTVVARRSIAHTLHEAGFPVVVASQFPLTVAGSNILVEAFYRALLAGQDARMALHRARVALYEARRQAGHDWTSVVGYARLPEGYAEHLLDVRLEAALASLRSLQATADRLVAGGDAGPGPLEQLAAKLHERIAALLDQQQDSAATDRRDVFEEHLGLLGSAEKRLAEVCFARSRLGDAVAWTQRAGESLQRARGWYTQAYRRNLSHHWSGIQQLALEAVLDGRIANPHLWHAVVAAAQIDRDDAKRNLWALGSLVEAYLLAPAAGQAPAIDSARSAIAAMKAQVDANSGQGDAFPLESTARQLRRYTDWWSRGNGFFPGTNDLAADAGGLLRKLEGCGPRGAS
jgi:hypothetical protein